jgi:hypothetical protein
MSFDLNLTTTCDHRIYKEPVTLDDDRRTLRVSKPVSASKMDVFASDDLVPKSEYLIVSDTQFQSKVVMFKKKWKSVEDYFSIGYITIKNFCSKCVGLEIIQDIGYDIRGNFLVLRNEPLLLQNLEKFVITELRSNPFQQFIGTGLVQLIGQRISDTSYIVSKVTQEINTTLEVLKDLQNVLVNSNRAVVNGELLDTVDNIKANFDRNDPTILRVDITVRAKSGRGLTFSQFIKIS